MPGRHVLRLVVFAVVLQCAPCFGRGPTQSTQGAVSDPGSAAQPPRTASPSGNGPSSVSASTESDGIRMQEAAWSKFLRSVCRVEKLSLFFDVDLKAPVPPMAYDAANGRL